MTFDEWFQSEQGNPYDSMYVFAKAAWDVKQAQISELQKDIEVQDELIKKQGAGAPYFSHYQQALGKIDGLNIRVRVLEDGIRAHLTYHENGCVYLSHLVAPNVKVTGLARLYAQGPVDCRVGRGV